MEIMLLNYMTHSIKQIKMKNKKEEVGVHPIFLFTFNIHITSHNVYYVKIILDLK